MTATEHYRAYDEAVDTLQGLYRQKSRLLEQYDALLLTIDEQRGRVALLKDRWEEAERAEVRGSAPGA